MNRYFFSLCLILSILLMRANAALPPPPQHSPSGDIAAFATCFETPLPHTAGTFAYASASAYCRDSGDVIGTFSVEANIKGPDPYEGVMKKSTTFRGSLGKMAIVDMEILAGPAAITTRAEASVEVGGNTAEADDDA